MSNKPAIHIIGLPHTIVNIEYSHCAFTSKILRFSKMLRCYGWNIIEYSNGHSESGATEQVQILSEDELKALSHRRSDTEDYSADVNNSSLTIEFNNRLSKEIVKKVSNGDIICHVFGPMPFIVDLTPNCFQVESGIGYTCVEGCLPYRIYESAIWMHWHLGRRHKEWGENYEFVVPNYYDIVAWPVVLEPKPIDGEPYIIIFGRIVILKGFLIIIEIAKRMPDVKFIICGQGDPIPWISQAPNIIAISYVVGDARAPILGNAQAILAPSSFIEPFCGAAVEAQLCGTPVVSSNFGAFWETVVDGVTGFKCNSLADYIGALRRVPTLDRRIIAERARNLYSLETVGKQYDIVFNNIVNQRTAGWYSNISHKFESVEF